ncbi:MAG: hypothetical protein B7Y84_14130 [Azorhizobium sp. 32-67-21]|nr:MAG: hypothetical protein B7Y84_14130 [Azorhizobium sp. 32-67-21]
MSIHARHQLLDDLAGPKPRPAPIQRRVERAQEPITLRSLMQHRYAGICVAAAYVLWVVLYFYAFQGG